MYKLVLHKKYVKKLKKFAKQNISLPELPKIVDLILQGKQLPVKYKDHKLKGKLKDFRECHIKPDILLLYKKDEKEKKVVILLDIGSHSEFFKY